MFTKVNPTSSMTDRRQILLQLTMRRDSLSPENSRGRKMFRYPLKWVSRARRQQPGNDLTEVQGTCATTGGVGD